MVYDDHTSIEPDDIMIRNRHVCAQLIYNLSKDNVTHCDSDIYWFWQMACTTGTVHIARFKVGSTDTVPGPTPVKRAIT